MRTREINIPKQALGIPIFIERDVEWPISGHSMEVLINSLDNPEEYAVRSLDIMDAYPNIQYISTARKGNTITITIEYE